MNSRHNLNFTAYVTEDYKMIADSAVMEPDADVDNSDGDSKMIENSIGQDICMVEGGEMLDLFERELIVHEVDGNVEPYVGMEFNSEEAAMIYYDTYAKHAGFIIRVGNCHRSSRDGSVISRRFLCNKEGFRVNNKKTKRLEVRKPREITREGCKAMIMVRKEKSGKWVVTKLETLHNHPLGIPAGKGRRGTVQARPQVKYLGEDGENVPVAGAAAICSPWDLLIGDRFICRKLLQKLYDKALTIGLQGYAQLHQPHYSRLADWEGIKKSRSIRDFDNYATCLVGKFETVDTYYRRCSSTSFLGKVSVPLLCISALDDPVCTREAIPWDECRANKNVVLATTKHGGHLAYFEGVTAASVWWVRAVDEFLSILHSSPYMHRQKEEQNSGPHSSSETSIDQAPFVHVGESGLVAAMGNELTTNDEGKDASEAQKIHDKRTNELIQDMEQDERTAEAKSYLVPDVAQTSKQATSIQDVRPFDVTTPIRRCVDQLSRQNTRSVWLLAYIAIITSWPLVGSALRLVFKKKLKNALPAALLRR